jgi:formamidopyrimidine-DNA glycosylase
VPERPDVELYVARLRERVPGTRLWEFRANNPFIVRSVAPKPADFVGLTVEEVFRLGKRIVFAFEADRYVVVHLMIAGRFVWHPAPVPAISRNKAHLARFGFESGALDLQEQGSKKRASIHFVQGEFALAAHRRPGMDLEQADLEAVAQRLRQEKGTLKGMLTRPEVFDGIGNAYSDEILWHAGLSPVRRGSTLGDDEARYLAQCMRDVLRDWSERLQATIPGFPKPSQITAFRPDFAVHGRYGKPCPRCAMPVQRIVWAENEWNYCARCQNDDRILANRSLSRLLKDEFPRSIAELSED